MSTSRLHTMTAVWIALACCTAAAEPVLADSFDGNTLAFELPEGQWRVEQGALLSVNAAAGMSRLQVDALALLNWRMSFRVKRTGVPAHDQHFGVIFRYDDGTSLRLYCRGKTLHYWDRAGPKTFAHQQLGEDLRPPLPGGPQAPWTGMAITTENAYVQVDINGRPVGTLRREPSVLRAAELYAYHLDIAVDDIRIEPVQTDDAPSVTARSELAVRLNFDGSLTGQSGEDGTALRPLVAKGVSLVPGVSGQAVRITATDGERPVLHYPAGTALAGTGGTIMFWFRPQWDGPINDPTHFPWYSLFAGLGDDGKTALRLWQWHWLRADVPREEGLERFTLFNRCRGNWLKGDWHHVALVWNEHGWCKLYADGVPYERGLTGERYLPERAAADMSGIRSFALGTAPGDPGSFNAADGDVDDVRIYRTPLSGDAVAMALRDVYPVDLIVEQRFLEANAPTLLDVSIHAAGTMVIPPVAEPLRDPVEVRLRCRLIGDGDERTICDTLSEHNVAEETRVSMDVPVLEPGTYRLVCTVETGAGTVQRSFPIVAYTLQPPQPPTAADASTSAAVVHIDLAAPNTEILANTDTSVELLSDTSYREAGRDKADRFAVELEIPEALLRGLPVALDILWPDDKPRSMGWYMYPEAARKQHRDRLEAGIQSGEEYPLTGTMQTSRYLFYPDVSRYLFEVRTMVTGMPAAVASISLRTLEAPLPRLAVQRLDTPPYRQLGHMDEDQSFEILFRKHDGPDRAVRVLETLCNYLDYTGQELVSYPLLRYHAVFYPTIGAYPGGGLRPEGWIDLFLRVFETRNKGLIGTVNLYTLPKLYLFPDRADTYIEQDVFVRDAQGDLVRGHSGYVCNPLHPKVRSDFVAHVDEILRRYGRRDAFVGLDLWLSPTWTFRSLDHGYGDLTVARFTADTGITVPQATGRDRFRTRYAFLIGEAREPWLAWRAAQTTATVSDIDRMVHAVKPELPLYISIPFRPFEATAEETSYEDEVYREYALECAALKRLPSVVLVPQRYPTLYRHQKHWDRSETPIDTFMYNAGNSAVFTTPGRAATTHFLRYFESFNDSLRPEVYSSYFQSADVKPHGRFFLKEFASCLAHLDTTRMLIGAQPLGTAGRDTETREFARAFCALPAAAFADVPGPKDPVTVRSLARGQALYLYAVNTLSFPATARVSLSRDATVMDLSNGAEISTVGGRLSVALKPFELRSFHSAVNGLTADAYTTDVPAETVQWYRDRLEQRVADVHHLAAAGADVSALEAHLRLLREACSDERYAEAHRLLFATCMRELTALGTAATEGHLAEQARMIAAGRYAVNCGMSEPRFHRASSGRMFFPDQPFETGRYGHVGSYRSVIRSTESVVGTEDPLLYATEAYDIDEYRFTVPPGTYTVRLYLKQGWKPSAKPGVFVIRVDLEGTRVLDGADLFLMCNREFNRAIVREFTGISVTDGVLNIEFGYPPGGERTARLCNAIEIIPQGPERHDRQP